MLGLPVGSARCRLPGLFVARLSGHNLTTCPGLLHRKQTLVEVGLLCGAPVRELLVLLLSCCKGQLYAR